MKAKKLLSLILALAVVASCACIGFFNASAADEVNYNEYEKMLEAIKPENKYGLESSVNEGKIIQAWNWSYANIIANLETLAEQGFTTIQVSPPNEIKMPTKGVHVCEPKGEGGAPNGWWMFYQPAGFQLNESTDNALGVKAEFVEMCEKAHELGLKVIVDAVINHMGTDDDHIGVYDNKSTNPMDHVNPRAAEFEPELLAAKAFHDPWVNMTYKENDWEFSLYEIEEDLTQHCTSGLPDLATETQLVQDTIYDYFVELVEAGADGFRFDAAKHIETKHDTYFPSDFWEDTLIKLRVNYPDKELYAYGEILNKCGDGRPFHEYTELMDVTDSSSYWGIKDAVVNNGNGGNPLPFYQSEAEGCDPTTVNFTKENVIQWNESHDTYIDGGTSMLTVQQRNKIWALTAARQTITGIYFARPTDTPSSNNSNHEVRQAEIDALCQNILIGEANKTSWTNPEVAAVNQFDNYFGDAFEYCSVSNKIAVIERGGVGATLVNLGGMSTSVEVQTYRMADGIYYDAITGEEFVIYNGILTGQIGSTGIACIYYAEDTEPVIPEPPFDPYMIPVDPASGTFPVIKGYTTIVFSASQDWKSAYSYCWNDASQEALVQWPGTQMKKVTDNNGYDQKQYVAYIPEQYDMYIINNGNGGSGNQTIDLTVPESAGMYMDGTNSDGYYLVGYWEPNFYEYVLPDDDNTDPTDAPSEPTTAPDDPTEPITTEPTEPTTTEPTEPITTEPTEPADVITDEKTQISVEGAGEADLKVEEITDETTIEEINDKLTDEKVQSVYDITLESEGVAVQPDGSVTVKIPATSETSKVYRFETDGTLTDMNSEYADGFVTFTTEHFSLYVVTEAETETTQPGTSEPKPAETYLLGDADANGKINIKDVTTIQKFLARIDVEIDKDAALAAEGDLLSIKDATTIQKFLAQLLPADTKVGTICER